jgi:hypothetical protein
MTITQTVDITDSRRITLDVPPQIPAGKTCLVIQFPLQEDLQTDSAIKQKPKERNDALRRAYGAWKDNPWTNHLEDVNALRDEWKHRK